MEGVDSYQWHIESPGLLSGVNQAVEKTSQVAS